MTATYQQYINGPDWGKKRTQRLGLDDFKCVRCQSTERLEVHHLTYDRLGCERMDDLVTLCRICHQVDHGRDPDLPACLPASFFSERFWEKMRRECWQEAVAAARAAEQAVDTFVGFLGDDERADRVVRLLKESMRDLAAECGQEWDAT